jgi:hypothetical protein
LTPAALDARIAQGCKADVEPGAEYAHLGGS